MTPGPGHRGSPPQVRPERVEAALAAQTALRQLQQTAQRSAGPPRGRAGRGRRTAGDDATPPTGPVETVGQDDRPQWIDALREARPFLDNGAPNPDYYVRNLAFVNAVALWHLDRHGERLDVAGLVRSIVEEAKQRGIDLTSSEYQSMFDWLRDKDLLAATVEALDALVQQVEKLPAADPPTAELKKKWSLCMRLCSAIQQWARRDRFVAWTYIGRDQERGGVFDWQDFHLEMGRLLTSGQSALIVVPSGHGKTHMIMGLACCELGEKPNLRIGYVYNSTDVIKRVQFMRDIIESRRYRAVYPHVQIDRAKSDRQTGFFIKKTLSSVEPTLEGRSVIQRSEGVHYDRLIIDDPHTREAAFSEPDRREVVSAIDETWYKRLNPGGVMLGCMTRWHDRDWAGMVISRKRRAAEAGTIAAGEGNLDLRMQVYVRPVPHRVNESGGREVVGSLWPSRFPIEQLQAEQLNEPIAFARDRLCDPIDPGSQTVSTVLFYEPPGEGLRVLDRWLSLDPAMSVRREADFSGCVYIDRAYDVRGRPRMVVRRAEMIKRKPTALAAYVVEAFQRGQIDWLLYETLGPAGSALAEELTGAIGAFQSRVVVWKGLKIDKLERLKAVSILISRAVLFPGVALAAGPRRPLSAGDSVGEETRFEAAAAAAFLVEHLLRFTAVAHPHAVDALTQMLLYHRQFLQGDPSLEDGTATPDRSPSERRAMALADDLLAEFDEPTAGGAQEEWDLLATAMG